VSEKKRKANRERRKEGAERGMKVSGQPRRQEQRGVNAAKSQESIREIDMVESTETARRIMGTLPALAW